VPFVFELELRDRGRPQPERDCQVVLSDGKISPGERDQHLLHAMPYYQVLSISYSRGRDPPWNTPAGPAPLARVGGGCSGCFADRDTGFRCARTRNGASWCSVLANEAQALRAVAALEERTGRSGRDRPRAKPTP